MKLQDEMAPSKVTQHGDFKAGDPKSRGMNNEEKKADKARRMGMKGDATKVENQGETSHGELRKGDPTSRGMNNAEKEADKAAREGKLDGNPEMKEKTKSKSASAANDQKIPRKSMTRDATQTQDPEPRGNGKLISHGDFKAGDPSSRGMNNEEKKADKARREGKSGPEIMPSNQSETAHGELRKGDPSSRGMNNEEKKAEKAARTGGMNKSGEKSNNLAVKSGGKLPRGMNNEEKKADKARREGREVEGAGKGSGDDIEQSIEHREESTGTGGAGEDEGLTPDIQGGGYERQYSGTAMAADEETVKPDSATPINDVDRAGSMESNGKERASTLESEASVPAEHESEEEAPFGDVDKSKASKTGAEEAKRAAQNEKPERQSSRIKGAPSGKRKMQEARESEGFVISDDEERVKKASKKSDKSID